MDGFVHQQNLERLRSIWLLPASSLPVHNRGRCAMNSTVIKRSIVVNGHKTSVSLENAFWDGLKEIARSRDMLLSAIVAMIGSERRHGNLSSSIRLFVLDCYQEQAQNHLHRTSAASAMVALPLAHSPPK
jgi:predicted DNA-binding ribbon-helix-helix protein